MESNTPNSIYTRYKRIGTLKILSFYNHDINTSSLGSFDRYYWGWKKRDFSDSTLQYAIIPYIKATKNLNEGMLLNVYHYIKKISYKNGSVDQSYPFEYHPKTFLDIVPVLVFLLKNNIGPQQDIKEFLRRSVDFSLTREEKYGVIVNHIAHDMYQYLSVAKVLNNSEYYSKAKQNLLTIKNHTSEEGWHREYLGADTGYQTRTLKYLTQSLELFDDVDKKICEDLCVASTSFLDKLILPDGTIYSMFGSRNTALVYPSGIEYMAWKFPERFASLCFRVRKSITQEIAILPFQLEFDNFIRLYDDFLDAQAIQDKNPNLVDGPTKNNQGFHFPVLGIKKIVIKNFSIFIHYKYGGVFSIYKDDQLFYKEAGMLVVDQKGGLWGSKNLQENSEVEVNTENEIRIRTRLFKSIHQEITPYKLILLRLLNISILRFAVMADFFRKIIVNRIVTGKETKTKNLITRSIFINHRAVVIKDKANLGFIPKKAYRARYMNLFHMATSRYFHPVETDCHYYTEESIKNERSFLLEKNITLD